MIQNCTLGNALLKIKVRMLGSICTAGKTTEESSRNGRKAHTEKVDLVFIHS